MARRALDIFEDQLGAGHPYTAASHNNIGNSLLEQGRHIAWTRPTVARPYFEEAELHYREAVRIREVNLGSEHPAVALNLHNLGEAQRLLGAYEQALATWERSLAIKRKALGEDHPSVTMTMTGLGRVLLELGRRPEALERLELAASQRRAQDAAPESTGETFFALARAVAADLQQGPSPDRKRARELAREALAAYVKAGDDYRGEREDVERWLAGL